MKDYFKEPPSAVFIEVLGSLSETFPPRITLRQIMAFVVIARNELEYEDMDSRPETTLADLQNRRRKGQPVFGQSIVRSHIALIDLGLITASRSEHDKRAVSLRLTDKGKQVFLDAVRPIAAYAIK